MNPTAGSTTADRPTRTVSLCGQRVPHPGHVCGFFDSREQKYDVLVPFFTDAISAGDSIINIVDDAEYARHIDSLAAADIPVPTVLESGQLSLFTSEETYLRSDQGTLPRLLEFLHETLQQADREGRCIRTWGDMNWIGRSNLPVTDILEYESRVNYLYPSFTCTLLCAYDIAQLPAALMSDILATHPFAIVKGRLRENPFYVHPDDYLRMLQPRQA